MVWLLWKTTRSFLKILQIKSPCDSTIHFWLFILKTNGNQAQEVLAHLCSSQHYSQWPGCGNNLNCSLRDKWIKKTWYTVTVEYYSSLKKEGNLYYVTTCMNLWGHYVKWNKPITECSILHDSTYKISKIVKFIKWVEWWLPRAEVENEELVICGHKVSVK